MLINLHENIMKIHKKEFLKLVKDSLKKETKSWALSIDYYGYIVLRNYEIDVEVKINEYFLEFLIAKNELRIKIISTSLELKQNFIQKIYIYMLVKLYFSKKIKKQIKGTREKSNMINVDMSKSYIRIKKIKDMNI